MPAWRFGTLLCGDEIRPADVSSGSEIPVGGKSELPVAAVAGMPAGTSIGPNAGERLIPKYSGRTRERNTNAKFLHQLSLTACSECQQTVSMRRTRYASGGQLFGAVWTSPTGQKRRVANSDFVDRWKRSRD